MPMCSSAALIDGGLSTSAQVLQNEQDLSTKRNAFQFLCNHAEERAVNYLLGQIDNVALWGDILQMAVLDVIRKVRSLACRGKTGILGEGSFARFAAVATHGRP